MEQVRKANWAGLISIGLWSLLAILPLMAGDMPALLLLGIACSCACGFLFLIWKIRYGSFTKPLSYISKRYFVINAGCLLGAETTLIISMQAGDPMAAYLALNIWPVFTLLFAAMLLGQRLYWWHYVAAFVGVLGITLLAIPEPGAGGSSAKETMLALSFGTLNAVIWSLYSVLNRKFQEIPADCVALPLAFCAGSALLLHLLIEPAYSLANMSANQWLAAVLLGTMPWGMAYVLWGYAMRFGEIRMLSILGYIMPLLGIVWLLLFGYAQLTVPIMLATALIVFSAILGSKSPQVERK